MFKFFLNWFKFINFFLLNIFIILKLRLSRISRLNLLLKSADLLVVYCLLLRLRRHFILIWFLNLLLGFLDNFILGVTLIKLFISYNFNITIIILNLFYLFSRIYIITLTRSFNKFFLSFFINNSTFQLSKDIFFREIMQNTHFYDLIKMLHELLNSCLYCRIQIIKVIYSIH